MSKQMLYKLAEGGKSAKTVKMHGSFYDYTIVDKEDVEQAVKDGWLESPGKGDSKPKKVEKPAEDPKPQNIDIATLKPKVDADGDGLIDKDPEHEALRDEWEAKTGEEPDGRWGKKRIKSELKKLEA